MKVAPPRGGHGPFLREVTKFSAKLTSPTGIRPIGTGSRQSPAMIDDTVEVVYRPTRAA